MERDIKTERSEGGLRKDDDDDLTAPGRGWLREESVRIKNYTNTHRLEGMIRHEHDKNIFINIALVTASSSFPLSPIPSLSLQKMLPSIHSYLLQPITCQGLFSLLKWWHLNGMTEAFFFFLIEWFDRKESSHFDSSLMDSLWESNQWKKREAFSMIALLTYPPPDLKS